MPESHRSSLAEALIGCSLDAIFIVNADWTEMRRLAGKGLLPDTDSPSRDWMDRYLPAEDVAPVRRAVEQAIQGKSIFDLTHRVRRLDGQVVGVRSRAVPILDNDGCLSQWTGFIVKANAAQDPPSMPVEEGS